MSSRYAQAIAGKPRLLCRIFGHRMRSTRFVGSAYFKFAPEFEWVRKVTKGPWYGRVCKRCSHGAPDLRIYADDGTLLWGGQVEFGKSIGGPYE